MTEHHKRIVSWLRSIGAENVRVEPGRKHPRVVFVWHGAERRYVTAGTTGDSLCGWKNAKADLRQMLGIVKSTKTVGVRRIPRNRIDAAPTVACPQLSALADWRPKLLAALTPQQLKAQADAAWLGYWRQCMAQVGGRSLL